MLTLGRDCTDFDGNQWVRMGCELVRSAEDDSWQLLPQRIEHLLDGFHISGGLIVKCKEKHVCWFVVSILVVSNLS